MENIDFVENARKLKALLHKHDQAVNQIIILDSKIDTLDKKIFKYSLDNGITGQWFIRKSITEGVRKMYEKYRQNTWEKIQELSNLIIQNLDTDGAVHSTDTTQVQMDIYRRNENSDKLMQPMIGEFCLNYRNA